MDILLDGEMREEGQVLEDVSGVALRDRDIDASFTIENNFSAGNDASFVWFE